MKLETPRPNELEPTTLLRQLANVDYLLDVIIPPHEKDMRLKFDDFVSNCGTFRCLFGEFLFVKHGQSSLDKFMCRRWLAPEGASMSYTEKVINHYFGTPKANFNSIFGERGYGTLFQRKSRLLTHRDHLQAKIAEFTPVSAGSVAA